jgi:hypothetical protein
MRYAMGKTVTVKLDLARVVTGNAGREAGDSRAHLAVSLAF